MKKIILWSIAIAGLILSTTSFAKYLSHPQHSNKLAPVPVIVSHPKLIHKAPSTHVIGTLQAVYQTWIIPKIDGYIQQINFKEGEKVQKATPLIQLDDTNAKAQFSSAQVAYTNAESQLQRMQKLAKQGYVSKENLETQKAQVADKKAALAASKQALNDTTLNAPFNGYVGAKNIHVGDYVKSAQQLVQLTDKQHLKVIYHLPEKYLSKVELGQMITLHSQAYPKEIFQAHVSFISPSVNSDTGTFEVHALLNNKAGLLEPGGFVTVHQPLGQAANLITVPSNSLQEDLDGSSIFIVKNSKAYKQKVNVGQRFAKTAVITQGLTPKDTIIIEGQQNLHNEQAVRACSKRCDLGMMQK